MGKVFNRWEGGVGKDLGRCSRVSVKARRALKVSVKPFQRLAGPGQSPGRSRRSETPQDGYDKSRACVFGTGPAVLS